MEAPDVAKTPIFETTWLQGIVEFSHRKTDGGVILVYTLGNGHQFAVPLNGRVLELTRQAVSPVVVANRVPTNGHGASPRI